MKRRDFITNTALTAIAISTSGFIKFNGKNFEGDCETTTDILGPFYRPGSPIRNNLVIKEEPGEPVVLSGFVKHKDCITPYKNAKVELWHCDIKGIYDNQSADFRYRGTVMTDEKGFYSFQTILPVAYGGEGFIRPAHFHLMISAEGYQPLVTQLYFNGDVHIKKDPYASSPKAKKRILTVQKKNGTTKVNYDVSMSDVLHLEATTLDKLTGSYTRTAGKKKTVVLFKYENRLWIKNEAFGDKFEYTGNNTFEEAGNPAGYFWKLQFEILPGGDMQFTESYIDIDLSKKVFVYKKDK
jgi:catechol 1,2-dioxygenase